MLKAGTIFYAKGWCDILCRRLGTAKRNVGIVFLMEREQPRISINEVLKALQKVRLYEEQQEEPLQEGILGINRHKRQIHIRQSLNTKQKSILNYVIKSSRPSGRSESF